MTVYYVDPVSGSDAAAGTSFATAFATTQKGIDSLTAGDELRLCATGTETVSAQIDMDVGTGGQTAFTLIRGMDGTDGSTPAVYTMQGSGTLVSLINFGTDSKGEFLYWRDIVFDGNSACGRVLYNSADTIEYNCFTRCRVTGATGDGIELKNRVWQFIECEIDTNGDDGLYGLNNRAQIYLIGCSIHDNGNRGVRVEGGATDAITISHCNIWGNTAQGLSLRSDYCKLTSVTNCTIDGNGSHGIETGGGTFGPGIHSNSITNNGGYGWDDGASTSRYCIGESHNLYYGNTSGGKRSGSNNDSDVTGSDPLYASAGTGDFTPSSSSPLIGAAAGGGTIGAVPATAGGGGGGTSSVLGSAGMHGGMQ